MKDWIPLDAALARVWRNPSGEVGVRAAGPAPRRLLARLQSADDLVALLLYLAAAPGVEEVCVPYLAYSRQDRVAAPGDPVSIAVLARLLATTGVRRFATFDVHSPASFAAFAAAGLELRELSSRPYLERFLDRIAAGRGGPCWFVAPDHGAEARTRAMAAALSTAARPIGVVACTKKRDPVTRRLEGFAVADDAPATLGARPTVLAIDDICESGDTLLGVVGALRARYGPDVAPDFWTTHGVYSKGLDALLAEGRRAGCTDSYRHGLAHPRLTTLPLVAD